MDTFRPCPLWALILARAPGCQGVTEELHDLVLARDGARRKRAGGPSGTTGPLAACLADGLRQP